MVWVSRRRRKVLQQPNANPLGKINSGLPKDIKREGLVNVVDHGVILIVHEENSDSIKYR